MLELSKRNPKILYPNINIFIDLLKSENQILKWTGIRVLGYLSRVDKLNKIENLLPTLISFLNEKSLITASNTIEALTEIILYKTKYQDQLIKELLKVEKYDYYSKGKLSPECRNVTICNLIKAFNKLDLELLNRKDVLEFLKRQTKNTRPKVAQHANKLLKHINNKYK